jgi:hypothetical protein
MACFRKNGSAGCIVTLAILAALNATASADELSSKPRLVVLTDIGGDPDDTQSLVRLLVHANEFEIEALIASASGTVGELKKDIVQPDLIRNVVKAYGQVQPNLSLHANGFPPADQLLSRIHSGNPKRGQKNLGETHDTEGSRKLIELADRDDPRPLNITIWGGSTELAQALWRVRNDRSPVELKKFVAKLRVYTISYQDDTGGWIADEFPDLFYIASVVPTGRDKREAAYRGMYLGGNERLTSLEWLDQHVRKSHGPLGALYPARTWTAPNPHSALKEGDTPSWLYFLPIGPGDAEHPELGGWGGRFKKVAGNRFGDSADTVEGKSDARATVWRWREAVQNEFQARMDWCVAKREDANHPPELQPFATAPSRAISVRAMPGEIVRLSAGEATDPDGDDLTYRWFVYPEAGNYPGEVSIAGQGSKAAELTIPADLGDRKIHVILEATDTGAPPLTRYRRYIVSAKRK